MGFFKKKHTINERINNLPIDEAVTLANRYIAMLDNYLGAVQDDSDQRVCIPFDKALYVQSFVLDTFFWKKTVRLTFVELPRFKHFDVSEDSIITRTQYRSFLYHYLAMLDDIVQEHGLSGEMYE